MPTSKPSRLVAFRDALRSGSWLTPDRLRAYPTLMGAALLLALVLLVVTGHDGMDWRHRPFGTDFVGVWVAGREVLSGQAALPYDNAAHAAAQAIAFGQSDAFLPWGYPPLYLAVAAVLATMPYLVALAVFEGTTLLLYLAAVRRAASGIAARDWLVAAVAFPAVTINLLHGHNGLLSAALLAGGALALPRRPLHAGLLLGLLAYKPQFGLAIPVALLAGRHWRASVAAVATLATAGAATLIAFGPDSWRGFAASLGFTRRVVLEMGGIESYKLQSAFAAIRLVGGSVPLAYAAQALVSVGVLAGLAWLWRGAADARLKLAGLVIASLLATPYAVDYDMTMLGPALGALASHGRDRGFAPHGKSLLALAWLTPLLARMIAATIAVPFGWIVMVAMFGLVVATTRRDCMERRTDGLSPSRRNRRLQAS